MSFTFQHKTSLTYYNTKSTMDDFSILSYLNI